MTCGIIGCGEMILYVKVYIVEISPLFFIGSGARFATLSVCPGTNGTRLAPLCQGLDAMQENVSEPRVAIHS